MPAVDFALIQLEETPVNERTDTSVTPGRIATEKLFVAHTGLSLKPNPSHLDRSDEQRAILGAVPKILDSYAPSGSWSERCYLDDITWLLYLAGFTPTKTAGGPLVTDADQTTATGINALNSAVVNVGDTSLFPSAGTFVLAGATAVTYTGKTATSFTGCGAHPATVGGELINGLVPAGATKWVWAKRGGINAQTAQVILNYADEAAQLKGNGYAVSDMSFDGAGMVSASLLGLVLQRIAVDTVTVPTITSAAIPPIRKGDLYLSWLAGGGAIADFGFSITNPLNPDRSLSLPNPSNYPDLMEYGDEQVKMIGTIPKRVLAAADIDALMAASTFSAKARWRTPKSIGATAAKYTMWIDMPAAQLVDGDFDALGNKRRHGANFGFEAAYDETAGYDVRITVVNATATVGTSVGLV